MIASDKWPHGLGGQPEQEPDLPPDEGEVDLETLSVDDLHPTASVRRRQVIHSAKAAGGKRRSPLLPVLIGAGVLVVLAVGIFFGYSWFFAGGKTDELPVVQAMDDPVKVKPANPGGLEVPYQDQLVLNQEGTDGRDEPVVERLLPPPEAPQPPPREPEAAAPVQTPPEPPAATDTAAAASRPVQSSRIVEAPVPDQSEMLVLAPPSTGEAAPVPAPTQPAKTRTTEAVGAAPATGSYVVQLGSFTSTAGSEQAWARLQKAHPELLGDMSLFVQKALVNDRTYFRVQAGPVPNRATALDMCAQLKARKQDCLVVRR
jgi:cell division septation protein DedD